MPQNTAKKAARARLISKSSAGKVFYDKVEYILYHFEANF